MCRGADVLRRLGWPGFLLIGLVAGSAVGVTVAWAAFPFHPTPSTITACYPTSGSTKGELRFIDYQRGTRCHIGEAMLTWQRNVRWRGPWQSTPDYSPNDVVRYNGSAYLALAGEHATSRRPTRRCGRSWPTRGDDGKRGSEGTRRRGRTRRAAAARKVPRARP